MSSTKLLQTTNKQQTIITPSPSKLDNLVDNIVDNNQKLDLKDEEENIEYCVVNFYHLVDVSDPQKLVTRHKNWLRTNKIDIRGRIYISTQGINAQFGGEKEQAIKYAEWVKKQPEFEGLLYRTFASNDAAFPKLRLKYKPNLISLAGGMVDLPVTKAEDRAVHLNPQQWREKLEQNKENSLENSILLDVRNNYEWDAGHFEGAERPQETYFNETSELPSQLKEVDKDKEIIMYCTGGIRCDVFSTVLRKNGFTNLYTLDGGIQNYLEHEKSKHWKGSLFVFDSRLAITSEEIVNNEDNLVGKKAAVSCQICKTNAGQLPHLNCANIDCNKIFIACAECRQALKGCCQEGCLQAPRLLRPLKEQRNYGKWVDYTSDEEGKIDAEIVEKMKLGRAKGRVARRRRRKQRILNEKVQAQREIRLQRKKLIREAAKNTDQESSLGEFLSMIDQAEKNDESE